MYGRNVGYISLRTFGRGKTAQAVLCPKTNPERLKRAFSHLMFMRDPDKITMKTGNSDID